MRFEQVVVTPDMAPEWLTKNVRNRSVSRSRVAAYASDMRAGRWQLTAEPIAFDEDGYLSNGQHRLLAVIAAGVPVKFTVVWGVPKSNFEVIDQGWTRQLGQILTLHGVAHGNTVAAASRIIVRYERFPGIVWSTTSTLITTAEAEEYALAHQVTCVDRSALLRAKFVTASAWSAFAHIVQEQAPSADSWDEFHRGVVEGIGLSPGDPRLALRNFSGAKWGGGQSDLMACLMAWNHWLNDRKVNFIRAARGSLPMPKPM